MKNRAFERLLKQLETLTPSQKEIATSKLHQTSTLIGELVIEEVKQVKEESLLNR
ncbi:MAG: hypothetical protein U9R27_10165 [Campylobacterota bacterium]|nr:hypothetical protein [Campylobacterota bacterium]